MVDAVEKIRQQLDAAPDGTPEPANSMTARELQQMTFPPVKYIVPGYVPEGLTVLAGKPKIGKSWAALAIGIAVANGGTAFASIQCEQGNVLYLALEDNPRRLQYRLGKVLPYDEWPDRLRLRTDAPVMDEAGIETLTDWADSVPKPRLVIIDTFARVRRKANGNDSTYDGDYKAVTALHRFSNETGIAVVLVHHVRKMDSDDPLDTVSGSTGFTGAADAVLVLTRDKSSADAILYGRGRDIEEIETALAFDPGTCTWKILGDADDYRRTNERQEIINVLRDADEPMGPGDIAAETGQPEVNVRRMLSRLVEDQEIKRIKRGRYEAY